MSPLSLEQRVAALEEQMAKVQAQPASTTTAKDWRRTVGKFPQMQEVFAEAMKLREADRKKARRPASQARRTKS